MENNQTTPGRVRAPSTTRPSTGRSNKDATVIRKSTEMLAVRCQSANAQYSARSDSDVQTKLLNSMAKDYIPYDNPAWKKHPPIFPPSKIATVQPGLEYISRTRSRQSCPQWVIDSNEKKEMFDRSAVDARISEKDGKQFCKTFLDRNRDSLWKYDTKYIGQTPRTVYKDITSDSTLMNGKLTHFHYKEQRINAATSERMADILTNPCPAREANDPNLLTLTTTRNQRKSRRFELLKPANKEMSSGVEALRHRRGYCHVSHLFKTRRHLFNLKT